MKIRKIRISRREAINVGEYENLSPEVSLEISLGSQDSVEEAYDQLRKKVDDLWMRRARTQIKQVIKRRTNERDEVTSDLMEEVVDFFWKDKKKKPL